MTDFTLYCFLESGNSYKPAIMLELCEANWQAQWVNFFKAEHRSPEYLAMNSMGEVPALVDHTLDNAVINQSGVMLLHLSKHFDKFGPDNDEEYREIMRWILFDNHKLTGNLAVYRFLNKFMNKGDTPEAEFMQGRMIQAFKVLNRHLEGRDWTVGNKPTIADLSMIGYLYWPDHYNVTWDEYPNIKAWLERITNLPNYKTPEEILPTGPVSA